MATTTLGLPDALLRYVRSEMVRESEAARGLRLESDKMANAGMRMSPEQGQFMALLVALTAAKRCLEVGTFVGYSALWMAEALPAIGRIVTCEIDPAFPAIGRPFWKQAGVEDRIDLRIGPALETLDALLAAGGAGSFDLAFLDADKERYADYYRRSLKLVRAGGLILVDNVFWDGWVADPARTDRETEAIRETTRLIQHDATLQSATVAIGDGLTIVRKMA